MNRPLFSKAFTLIEMLIVLAIFSLMTALLLANYNKFGGNLLVTNLAYDIALSIREAQTYGIGVRGESQSGQESFDVGYGVYFSKALAPSAPPNRYIIFSDSDKDRAYTGEATDPTVKQYTLQGGNLISGFCGQNGSTEINCSNAGSLQSINALYIDFLRPYPDAIIAGIVGSGPSQTVLPFQLAHICIRSRQAKYKRIEVSKSGQISVKEVDPDNDYYCSSS